MNNNNVKGKIWIRDTTDLTPTAPAISHRFSKADIKKHTEYKKALKLKNWKNNNGTRKIQTITPREFRKIIYKQHFNAIKYNNQIRPTPGKFRKDRLPNLYARFITKIGPYKVKLK